MNALGFGPAHGSEGYEKFIGRYGLIQTKITTKEDQDNRNSKNRRVSSVSEIPGIMPMIQTDVLTDGGCLLEFGVFLELTDIGNLPPKKEEIILVNPEPEQHKAYHQVRKDFELTYKDISLGRQAALKAFAVLSLYSERPWDWETVKINDVSITTPANLDQSVLYPKETELIRLVRNEISEGRKTLVYVHNVNLGIVTRLQSVLADAGIKTEYLASSIDPRKRMEWFERVEQENTPVVICNPSCVATGLDLVNWHTIVNYQLTTNIVTNTQANNRIYRIGAKKEARIFYLGYSDTIQETIMAMMGRKKQAMMSVQGRFTTEGLAALGCDFTQEIIKTLIRGGATQRANEIWNRIREMTEAEIKQKNSLLVTSVESMFDMIQADDPETQAILESISSLFSDLNDSEPHTLSAQVNPSRQSKTHKQFGLFDFEENLAPNNLKQTALFVA